MVWRRVLLAVGLLGFVAAVSATSTTHVRAIYKQPTEIRKRNYVRLSTETCDECMTLEDFYAGNPLGFVLFFERALMGGHKYKEAIVRGWMEVCQDLRWSRIACGMVDMVSDRKYAERYIDPKTAPAHIVVRNSEPVMAMQEQVQPLLKKPGDKATMLAHVGELLKDEGSMGSLTISAHVTSVEEYNRLMKRHQVVIVAFTGEEKRLSDVFRAAVQEAVLVHGLSTKVDEARAGTQTASGRTGKGGQAEAKDHARIAFVAAHGKPLLRQAADAQQGAIRAFVGGTMQPGVFTMKSDAKLGDAEVLEAVMQLGKEFGSQVSGHTEAAGKPEL